MWRWFVHVWQENLAKLAGHTAGAGCSRQWRLLRRRIAFMGLAMRTQAKNLDVIHPKVPLLSGAITSLALSECEGTSWHQGPNASVANACLNCNFGLLLE